MGGWVTGKGIGAGGGGLGVVLVTAPECLAATAGVAVAGRGTETLLSLVVAGKKDLEYDRDQIEEARQVSITIR